MLRFALRTTVPTFGRFFAPLRYAQNDTLGYAGDEAHSAAGSQVSSENRHGPERVERMI